ncbi:chorismate-binding protein [Ideonella sp. DXS22W]|uniref:Chorismate-binding protein n=1 Tax=Pseudaquabacterium inlustre TaxID=2984192 RepID=A0ABU9CIC4_9BURK
MPCFALLDDAEARPGHALSRLYTRLVREHRCTDPQTLDATCQAVAADQARGLHALLLIDYEWGLPLQRLPARLLAEGSAAPALRVLMFGQCQHLDAEGVGAWLATQAAAEAAAEPTDTDAQGRAACGVTGLTPSVSRAAFDAAIAQIHAAIARGETYQVNYTFRLQGQAYGTPTALYQALRARQPVPFGALLALPEAAAAPFDADAEAGADAEGDASAGAAVATHVLSCSPELFLRHTGGELTARPMKGTAARQPDAQADAQAARALAADVKNRAENLMIVDLLRNDLGRVAQTGTVRVPALFAVEPYATVWQMTSTVQARLRPGTGLAEVLRASFPCGSITGAPKRHTMGLIGQLEDTARGLYCGAIGWLDAPAGGQACGDFCLSVAIRTLTLGPPAPQGLRPLTLGVGAGIVQDSVAAAEWDECRLKARFLTDLDPGFELFETVLCTAEGQLPLLPRHLARLQRSATALGFALDISAAEQRLRATAAALPRGVPHRLRLALRHGGGMAITHAVLALLPAGAAGTPDAPVRLRLADAPLPAQRPLSAHKTTLRAAYDAGVRLAEQQGAFDTVFCTPDGRLVEGGRSAVFVRLGGRWFTPPLSDGALPGVMRSVLLDDPAWNATERSVALHQLREAEDIVVCNALRGVLHARLDIDDDLAWAATRRYCPDEP